MVYKAFHCKLTVKLLVCLKLNSTFINDGYYDVVPNKLN